MRWLSHPVAYLIPPLVQFCHREKKTGRAVRAEAIFPLFLPPTPIESAASSFWLWNKGSNAPQKEQTNTHVSRYPPYQTPAVARKGGESGQGCIGGLDFTTPHPLEWAPAKLRPQPKPAHQSHIVATQNGLGDALPLKSDGTHGNYGTIIYNTLIFIVYFVSRLRFTG